MSIYNLVFSKTMSRSEELEADTHGVKVCAKSGFDPIKGSKFFEKQKESSHHFLEKFLSTHPMDDTRISNI